jgi:hypothetical protein
MGRLKFRSLPEKLRPVRIDSIKYLSVYQKTGIYGEFLYLTSAASYPITSGMSTMTYPTR